MNLPIYGCYTKSNILWIGNYPDEWFITKVKYEAYVKARVGWHGLKSDDFTDEGPFLVTGSDFKSSRIHWGDCYHCDLNRYEQDPYIQLRNGDLLITKDGTIGKVALVDGLKTNEKATLNSGVFVVRPLINNFSTKFYFWLLQSKVFTDFVDYNKTGSTIVHLYQDTFVNFSYASPQLKEQIQIAAFLDHETAKIDNLIEKQQQLIELLKEKRQAVISHAVTKGLNPDVPMKDSGVEWLGEVPAHWDICLLKFKCSAITDGAHISPDTNEGEHYFVSIKDIKKGIIDFNNSLLTSSASYKYLVKTGCKPFSGDILFSKDGTIGQTAIVPDDVDFVVASSLIIIRADKEKALPVFMDLLLQSSLVKEQVESFVKGAALRRLSIQNLEKVFGIFPTMSEQQIISDYIYAQLNRLDVLESKAVVQIQLLEERRTALISAAVTGKIDVRDWVAPDTQDVEEPQEANA
ncbi:TPA: restriction endonuclease subunit S [Klebsiella aerogenes]|nr:restriction endonuclease subunit S [Klebsiella aerogenes]HBV9945582.1 restriction endonuclease subunit S [Klebsiella aerogenes]HDU2903616.1 restriction endonuclease subunit S [Klebsiella aerogenes]